MLSILLIFALSLGQQTPKTPTVDARKARILSAFDNQGGDLLNLLYKIGLEVQGSFDPKQDTFAIRVCSNEPLRIALPLAAGAPFLTTIKLEKLGVPKSRIYYLRQNKSCALSVNGFALTEYWWVPQGAEFPEHVEARSADNLVGTQFTHRGGVEKGDRTEVGETEWLTPKSYAAILEQVVALLKEHKNAITVIEAPYRRSSSSELKKRLAETESYLKRNGISSYRIQTKRMPWGFQDPRDQYPNLFVVIEN